MSKDFKTKLAGISAFQTALPRDVLFREIMEGVYEYDLGLMVKQRIFLSDKECNRFAAVARLVTAGGKLYDHPEMGIGDYDKILQDPRMEWLKQLFSFENELFKVQKPRAFDELLVRYEQKLSEKIKRPNDKSLELEVLSHLQDCIREMKGERNETEEELKDNKVIPFRLKD